MRAAYQILFFILFQTAAYAQVKNNCRLIDTSGHVILARMDKYDIIKTQEKLVLILDSSKTRIYHPAEIRSLEYIRKADTLKFETIDFGKKKILAYLQKDWGFLKFYLVYYKGGKYIKSKIVVFKDDIDVSQVNAEADNSWMARLFCDYPLLSAMAQNKQFDIIRGYEGNLVMKEYISWRTGSFSTECRDTSKVLKAIVDANKLYKSKKYLHMSHVFFWCTFPLIFVSSLSSSIMADAEPKYSHLGLAGKAECQDPTYLNAYKLRAHTLKAEACLKGVYLY